MLIWPSCNFRPGKINMVQVPIPHLKEVSLTYLAFMHGLGLIIFSVLFSHLPSPSPSVISAQIRPFHEADLLQV